MPLKLQERRNWKRLNRFSNGRILNLPDEIQADIFKRTQVEVDTAKVTGIPPARFDSDTGVEESFVDAVKTLGPTKNRDLHRAQTHFGLTPLTEFEQADEQATKESRMDLNSRKKKRALDDVDRSIGRKISRF